MRNWRSNNREHSKQQMRESYHRHVEARRAKMREKNQKLKLEVLGHYSVRGVMCCSQCGYSNIQALVLDHIKGGGNKQRLETGSGSMFYRWIRNHNYPEGYQILCSNCNHIKSHSLPNSLKESTLYIRSLKLRVLSHYSDGSLKCAQCGFLDSRGLCIDHINGGGKKQRKELGYRARGSNFYIWLRKNKYPEGYQVLCMNCNTKKGRGRFRATA